MPLIFSPVDLAELSGPFRPLPRSVFLMVQLGGTISAAEVEMRQLVEQALIRKAFKAVTAAAVPGTGDYLQKIVDLIRGCGVAVAIFSDLTPARTLANIFFEVGVAGVLGKPVQLLLTGTQPPPSDFVRTEWIRYDPVQQPQFVKDVTRAMERIDAGAEAYRKMAQIALEAEEPDLEAAFERLKQAILISDDVPARIMLGELHERLKAGGRIRNQPAGFASHRRRLIQAVAEFRALLPDPRRRTIRARRHT